MDVVARLQPWSARLRHHQIVPLRNADMDRVLPVGVTRIALGQKGMTGQRPDHRLVRHGLEQPEHDRIAEVGAQHRRIGVAVDGAAEDLGRIRIRP